MSIVCCCELESRLIEHLPAITRLTRYHKLTVAASILVIALMVFFTAVAVVVLSVLHTFLFPSTVIFTLYTFTANGTEVATGGVEFEFRGRRLDTVAFFLFLLRETTMDQAGSELFRGTVCAGSSTSSISFSASFSASHNSTILAFRVSIQSLISGLSHSWTPIYAMKVHKHNCRGRVMLVDTCLSGEKIR